jgi:hypothetical protein
MALHKDLQIYRPAYELNLKVAELTAQMPRHHKAAIGADLRRECMALVTLIYRANIAHGSEKVKHLTALLERLQLAELMLRMSQDLRLISPKHYAQAIGLTDSVGKQANGWRAKFAAPAA